MHRLILAVSACLLVAGCDTWMGESEGPPLPGKRIAVLEHDRLLKPDAGTGSSEMRLPPPEQTSDWPQAGGYAPHAMHHLELADNPRRAWTASIGSGSGDRNRLLSPPIVADGKLFALDADLEVRALDASGGGTIWSRDLTPESEDDGGFGGGLAFDDGKLFAATGFGEIVALDPGSGEILWRRSVSAPVRGAPVARGGRVVAVSVDNQTHALAADDGRVLWTHQGISELAGLLGASSPAIDGNVVIVPYSSGDIHALRLENGASLWSESLAGLRRTDAVSAMADIRGLPVIDRGRVFAIGNSDLMTAIDLRSGRRLWDREIGSMQTPWVAGDYLFVLSNNNELVGLEAATGRIRWVTPLQRWEDEEDRRGAIVWSGPLLASDRLIVASSHGWALSVSPYTGEVIGRERLPDPVTIPPVLAAGSLYFLTEDGDLVAYR